jgi:hypothetical protein
LLSVLACVALAGMALAAWLMTSQLTAILNRGTRMVERATP